nr:hypothetical protein [Bryobacter sp.]
GSRFLADYRLAPVPFVSNEQPYRKTPPLREGQRQLLKLLGERIPPDFDLGAQSDGLTFHHRRAGDTDIYFVTNLQPEAIETDVRFRTGGRRAERWDPMDASVTPLGAIPEGSRTRIPLRLDPWESLFVVFRPGAPDVPQPAPQWKNALTIDGPWDMELEGVRFPRRALRIDKLADWKDDPATRHFSGTGIYRGSFAWAGAPGLVRLDLGVVGCVAEVLINGKPAGTRILRPYRFDVSKLLVRGRNRIEIRVTNLLIHHVQGMTGDVAVPAALEAHYGKAIAPPQRSITAFERDRKFQPLGPSGLIGPVTLSVESER